MNDKPITQSKDADLRNSLPALMRAASKAREVARRTGTRLVILQEGRVRFLEPLDAGVAESGNRYGRDT